MIGVKILKGSLFLFLLVIALAGLVYSIECGIPTPKTCSETWGFDCSTGPPETGGDNTFDNCSNGAGGEDDVQEIYINATSIIKGDSIRVTCTYDPYISNDYYHIWYYNGTGWKNLYTEGPTGSTDIVNKTVTLTPDNFIGTHWVRCSIDYSKDDNDSCSDLGTYYDNDDINFTVEDICGSDTEKTKFNISLTKGWNLISFPLNLTNKTLPKPLESIEGNYSKLFTYDGKWIELKDNDKINETLGYWINMTNDDTLAIEGEEFHPLDYDLKQGWNLVSYTSLNKSFINETLKGVNYSIVYSYNGTWLSYVSSRNLNTLKYFIPSYGYWVKVPEDVA